MIVATFDTHAAVEALTGAGFDAKQTETITDTVREAVIEGIATKADLKADVTRIEDKMATKADLYRAMFGSAAFIVAIAGAAIGSMQVLG